MSAGTDTIHSLFPTLVAEAWYPHHARDQSSILAAIHAIRDADDQGRAICKEQYHRGYTSFFSRRDLTGEPAFSGLVAFLRERARAYAAFQKWDLKHFDLCMSSLWININPQDSFHPDHVHPYSHISGVFYVSCARDSGDIVFHDPRVARSMVPPAVSEASPANVDVVKMRPEDGKAVLFPAWLTHGVNRNPTAVDRISMSYNFDVRPL